MIKKGILESFFEFIGILLISFLFAASIGFFELTSLQTLCAFFVFFLSVYYFHGRKKNHFNILSDVVKQELRIVILDEDISYKSATKAFLEICYLNRLSSDPIKLLINSHGGSAVWTKFFTYGIKSSKAPMIGVVIGVAYSGAAILLQLCSKRFMFPEATLLIHNPKTNYDIARIDISLEELEHDINILSRILGEGLLYKVEFKNIIVQRSGISAENLGAIEDKTLSATQAQNLNLIDGIITKI